MQLQRLQQTKAVPDRDKREKKIRRIRRLSYLISGSFAVVAVALLCLNFTGIYTPVDKFMEGKLERQRVVSVERIRQGAEEVSSCAETLSGQLTETLEHVLKEENLSFEELSSRETVLTQIQSEAYDALYTSMQAAPCSGAFYFLNATIYAAASEPYYNGIYLKFENSHETDTETPPVSLFRGASKVAWENGIGLHGSWQLEMQNGRYYEMEQMLHEDWDFRQPGYRLSTVYDFPDTWERARYLYRPIFIQEKLVGICGFEISDQYFQSFCRVEDEEDKTMACVLLTEAEQGFRGQVAGNQSGYIPAINDNFTIEQAKSLTLLRSRDKNFVGRCEELSIGDSVHAVAAMMPVQRYYEERRDILQKISALLLAAAVVVMGLWQYAVIVQKRNRQEENSEQFGQVSEIGELLAALKQREQETGQEEKKTEDLKS